MRIRPRRNVCAYPGCTNMAAKRYCGRSCSMKALRASQTPERRSEIGRVGKSRQRNDDWERFRARLRVMADTEEQRWYLAYCYGRRARATYDYKSRRRQRGAA